MNSITEKILRTGIVDKHVVKLVERWGTIDIGSIDVKKATARAAIIDLLEEVQDELDAPDESKTHDVILDALHTWKVEVLVRSVTDESSTNMWAFIDRFGRFYFKDSPASESWIVPGSQICVVNDALWMRVLDVKRVKTTKSENLLEVIKKNKNAIVSEEE